MNKRKARERALAHAAMILDAYLNSGSDTLYETYDEEDADKINAELDAITQRLFERGAALRETEKPPQTP